MTLRWIYCAVLLLLRFVEDLESVLGRLGVSQDYTLDVILLHLQII